GFEPGAGTMEVTEQLIEDYDLELDLVPSSEPAMLAAIKEAVKEEKPIVAPLWQPHGIFSEVDLKFLDDPQKTYGEIDEISLATCDDFKDDHHDVYEWLTNWSTDEDETMGDLINVVKENDDPEEGAKEWIEEIRDLTDEWME